MYQQTIAEVPLEQHSKPTRGEQCCGEMKRAVLWENWGRLSSGSIQ